MTKAELVELVRKILAVEGTEAEIDGHLAILREHVLHPGVTDLLFHSEEDLTAEEIVDRALAYQPIALPSSSPGARADRSIDLKDSLRARIEAALPASRELLVDFAERGGSQQHALNVLNDLRMEVDEAGEDQVLELMDIVVGFCPAHLRVWPERMSHLEQLFSELRARGWRDEGDILHAPQQTMYLVTTVDWPRSLASFLADMRSRRRRLVAARQFGHDTTSDIADVDSAIEAIEALL